MTQDTGKPFGTDPDPVGTVMALLRRQVDLYRRLEGLAGRQRNLIAEADPQPLLQLLADRQKLTDELSVNSGVLEPYRANWSDVRARFSDEQRQSADALLTEAGERLGRILAADRQDAQLLAARKAQTASALAGVRCGRQMLNAYGQPSASAGRHLNRMDEE
ncbi:MAG: flagellar export chaperone FlgN [Phycisphaerae bacterium]|nr:flagellar export chaperone FlgN [Phycisphaerae bacterium]